jgi:hypothetical protein
MNALSKLPLTPPLREAPYDVPVVADIRKEWDWVKIGIAEILTDQPQLTYRAEDVYAECVSGDATLFILEKNFAVTTIYLDRFTGDKILLVWLGWGKNVQNAFKFTGFFEQVARDCGCAYLEGKTSIDRLGEYYLENGWELETRIFRRKLDQDEEK